MSEDRNFDGFPIGHFYALRGAIERGEEPRQEDVDAIEAWRNSRISARAAAPDAPDPMPNACPKDEEILAALLRGKHDGQNTTGRTSIEDFQIEEIRALLTRGETAGKSQLADRLAVLEREIADLRNAYWKATGNPYLPAVD